MWSDSTSPPPARLSTRAPQLTLLRHAGHGRELRQNPRAVPQPSGPWPPLPSSGAGVPTTVVHVRADAAVCTSARLGARRAHSRRCAGVVDALLGDALRWRRVFLHWYARRPAQAAARCSLPFLFGCDRLSTGAIESSLEVSHVQWKMMSVAARLRQARASLRPGPPRARPVAGWEPEKGARGHRHGQCIRDHCRPIDSPGLSAHPVAGAVSLHRYAPMHRLSIDSARM